jgi:hypothetical protein
MNFMKGTSGRIFAAVAVAAILSGCGRKDDAAVATADTGIGMGAPPPAMSALRVSEVETGKAVGADKQLTDDSDDFGVRDTIYVAVKTEGSGSATLAAKWTFQDGQTVDESSQSISTTGDAWHEFHIQKASAWPKGKYKVEVSLNGTPADSDEFEIK